MQNKPNFQRHKIAQTPCCKKDYENIRLPGQRKNKPNFPIEDPSLSPLVASTPGIKPVSASSKVTKNAKKAFILWCFGDVSTRFRLFSHVSNTVFTPKPRSFYAKQTQSNPLSMMLIDRLFV